MGVPIADGAYVMADVLIPAPTGMRLDEADTEARRSIGRESMNCWRRLLAESNLSMVECCE